MPLGIQCGHIALHDGFITPLAVRGKLLIVAFSAEGLEVFLVEPLGTKVLAAQRAEEVFGMPRLVQGTHYSLQGEEREGSLV